MRKAVLIVVIVLLLGGVAAYVWSTRADLDDARGTTEQTWTPLVKPLDARYDAYTALAAQVNTALGAAGQPDPDAVGTKAALARWKAAVKAGGAHEMADAANELEARIGRLRAVVAGSARLGQVPEVTQARAALDAATVPDALVNPYNDAVHAYQRERERAFERVVARLFGFDAVPTFEPSGAT